MTCSSLKKLPDHDDNVFPESIQLQDLPEIISSDALAFGAGRTHLIETLISENQGNAWLLRQNNLIAGLALGREGRKFNQIGPVIADNFTDARMLIKQVLRNYIDKPMVADVPDDKVELIEWLGTLGFISQRHFVRMYQHTNPFPGNRDKQYLICGPEFG